MKLQFAFGNPSKKRVAKRKKPRKNRSMAKKKHKSKKVRAKKRKNPKYYTVTSKATGKRKYTSPKYRTPSELKKFIAKEKKTNKLGMGVRKLEAQYKAAPEASAKKAALRKKLAIAKGKRQHIVNEIQKERGNQEIERKTLRRYEEDADNDIKYYSTEGKPVAKKKRKKRKASKRRKVAKKAKAAAPKKRRSKKRKSSKRRKHAKKAAAPKVHKKRRHGKKRKSAKRRRRSKMVTHKHAKSTRHIRRGSSAVISGRKKKGSYRVKAYFGKGKKKVKISGSVRVRGSSLRGRIRANPHRRNPMAANVKKLMGLEVAELGALAAGGALVPIINKGIGKIPGMNSVVAMINQYAGPQATGSIVPILVGILANYGAEHVSGDSKKYLKAAGEGLCAAGVIGLAMGISQTYVTPMLGLGGINYTPSMRGINYTPRMGIMPQLNGGMGSGPDFGGINYTPSMHGADYGGGGYTQNHKFSRADFGQAQDEDYDISDDDMLSDNMAGVMS